MIQILQGLRGNLLNRLTLSPIDNFITEPELGEMLRALRGPAISDLDLRITSDILDQIRLIEMMVRNLRGTAWHT